MDRDMDKNLQTLELDKVLALLAEQTTCDDAKEAALALRPAADPGRLLSSWIRRRTLFLCWPGSARRLLAGCIM